MKSAMKSTMVYKGTLAISRQQLQGYSIHSCFGAIWLSLVSALPQKVVCDGRRWLAQCGYTAYPNQVKGGIDYSLSQWVPITGCVSK